MTKNRSFSDVHALAIGLRMCAGQGEPNRLIHGATLLEAADWLTEQAEELARLRAAPEPILEQRQMTREESQAYGRFIERQFSGEPSLEQPHADTFVDSIATDGVAEKSKGDLEDAERYRWLKSHHLQLGPDCWIRTGDDLDDAIDAEMRAENRGAVK